MEVNKTARGFCFIQFEDRYGELCSLQSSSLAGEECVWFGIDEAKPRVLVSKLVNGATGWVDFPLPDGVETFARMHLTRKQVAEILPHLQKFVETGEI